jgi:ribokinase
MSSPVLPVGRPTVVVVGAINVDLVVDAETLPGPGETVLGDSLRRYGGGKGANAAVAAARVGARTVLIGAVGVDDEGRGALRELAAEGVDVTNVDQIPDKPTGVALIVVARSGENQIAVGAGANMKLSARHVVESLRAVLPQAGCVLVSTEIGADAVRAAVDAAVSAGVPCLLNPAPVVDVVIELLDRGPLLTPNRTELDDLHDALQPRAPRATVSVAESAAVVGTATGAAVVVTLGGDGALVLEPGSGPIQLSSHEAPVRDTTGAGDTFNGVLAVRIACGDSLPRAVRVAVAAGSLSVQHVGARTGMPVAAAIDEFLASSE